MIFFIIKIEKSLGLHLSVFFFKWLTKNYNWVLVIFTDQK